MMLEESSDKDPEPMRSDSLDLDESLDLDDDGLDPAGDERGKAT